MHKSSIELQGNITKPLLGNVVNYNEVLIELNVFNLSNEFDNIFNQVHNAEIREIIKARKLICKNATCSLVRSVISKLNKSDAIYEKWLYIFQYYLQLPFERNPNKLFKFLNNL